MRVVYMQYSYKARICLHVLTLQHFCCTYKYQKYKELSAYNGTKNTRSCLHNQLSFLLLHQQYKELSVHSNLSNASGFLYTHTSTKGTRKFVYTLVVEKQEVVYATSCLYYSSNSNIRSCLPTLTLTNREVTYIYISTKSTKSFLYILS